MPLLQETLAKAGFLCSKAVPAYLYLSCKWYAEIRKNALRILRSKKNRRCFLVECVKFELRTPQISNFTDKTLDVLSENMYNGCYIQVLFRHF
jgi:hypothetical protein